MSSPLSSSPLSDVSTTANARWHLLRKFPGEALMMIDVTPEELHQIAKDVPAAYLSDLIAHPFFDSAIARAVLARSDVARHHLEAIAMSPTAAEDVKVAAALLAPEAQAGEVQPWVGVWFASDGTWRGPGLKPRNEHPGVVAARAAEALR
jgi:hypothetical protein